MLSGPGAIARAPDAMTNKDNVSTVIGIMLIIKTT